MTDKKVAPARVTEEEAQVRLMQAVQKIEQETGRHAPEAGQLWVHYRGKIYEVLHVGLDEETLDVMVTYRSFSEPHKFPVWNRKLRRWMDLIDVSRERDGFNVFRFTFVGIQMGLAVPKSLVQLSQGSADPFLNYPMWFLEEQDVFLFVHPKESQQVHMSARSILRDELVDLTYLPQRNMVWFGEHPRELQATAVHVPLRLRDRLRQMADASDVQGVKIIFPDRS